MKNLKIIQSCLVGGEHTEAGTVLKNVDNHIAAELVHSGRAEEIKGDHEVIGNRDPEVTDRDPKPSKKGKDAPAE